MAANLLEARGIEKSYGGVRALKHVSFDLRPGEVHAIVGENGAGKSTLIKILTGAVQPDAGEVRLDGDVIANNSPHRSRQLGIAAIYQQPAIFPDLTVAENIALINESGGLARRIDWPARHAKAAGLLKEIGAEISPDRIAGTLTMPEQQLVEIAKALGGNVRVLILDEPTASLTDRETDRLFAIIGRLREQGAGIVYISHRLEELPRIANRITVLRDGETIETRDAATTGAATLIGLMAGRELSTVFPKRTVPVVFQGAAPVLEVSGLTSAEAGIRDITFSVRAGEILGFAGLVGAGRTQLAETLFGLTPADAGVIRVGSEQHAIRTPEQAIAAGIAYVPEDRRQHGVVSELPIRANMTLAILTGTFLDQAAERTLAETWVHRLGIKTDGIDAPALSLSGGNQQKVAIARWLATDPKVLILDEPTQGIDVGAKAECHRIMRDLAAEGLAIIMISSELAEILGMSDRIAVMRGGRLTAIVDRADASAESILEMAIQ